MNFDCGIYTITSPSGKQYVGSAASFKKRWRKHLECLRRGTHGNQPLQRAYKKYGEDALVFSKIAFVPNEDLLLREQEQIDARDRKNLYNAAMVAGAPMAGRKHTAKSRARMSDVQKGLGKTMSAEARAKISASKLGKPRAAETCAKVSAALKGRKGWIPSEETRAKRSASLKGKTRSAETLAKMSAAQMGKTASDATRAKMSKTRGTSGYQGVSYHCRIGKWKASTRVGVKQKHIGYFDTAEMASDARLEFLRSLESPAPK